MAGTRLGDRIKLKWSKRAILGTVVIVLVLVAGAVAYFTVIRDSTPDNMKPNLSEAEKCRNAIEEARLLINRSEYKKGYEVMKRHGKCKNLVTAPIEKGAVEDAVASMVYRDRLARAAFLANDKEVAQDYAKEALEYYKSLTAEQRAEVPFVNSMVVDMGWIIDGTYTIGGVGLMKW